MFQLKLQNLRPEQQHANPVADPEHTLAIAERQLQDQPKRRPQQANNPDILSTYYLERRSFW